MHLSRDYPSSNCYRIDNGHRLAWNFARPSRHRSLSAVRNFTRIGALSRYCGAKCWFWRLWVKLTPTEIKTIVPSGTMHHFYLNSNHINDLEQLCDRFFTFCKISSANLRYLWRHLPTQLRIWRSAVATSDAAEKSCNVGAQLHSLLCTKAPKIFGKIYFLYEI